eukprot:TRINITY_DN1346_c0_g1_i2.p1 TRINITY_DN1346_c0_g1~~TRINITY_DN1346_c0_g1_i2.p1  ORF type:complete len:491 (-),score=139.78 TRINITY_DN1346_c0_g1_i2:34-1473(-)
MSFVQKLTAWEARLPEERELTDSSQIQQLQQVADEIVQAGLAGEVLRAVTREPKHWKETLLCTAYLADSASKIAQCPPMHVTVVHALFKETKRIKTSKEHKSGQDFVRNKVAQMRWIFDKHAPAGSSWNYIGVDDGCPDGSGRVMQQVVDKEGYKNVKAIFLQDAVDHKLPPFDKMESTEDSKKGGAVLYGLIKGAATPVPTNLKHVVAYCDADLSADLGMLGLLVNPILMGGAAMAAGQRYGCSGSFLVDDKGPLPDPESVWNLRDRVRMAWRHFARGFILPDIADVPDTQCAFKAMDAKVCAAVAPKVKSFGAGFDMELLCRVVSKGSLSLAPIVFVEDNDDSAFSSTADKSNENYFKMIGEILKMRKRDVGMSIKTQLPESESWLSFIQSMKMQHFKKMITGFEKKLGKTPPGGLYYKFDLEECKRLAFGKEELNDERVRTRAYFISLNSGRSDPVANYYEALKIERELMTKLAGA